MIDLAPEHLALVREILRQYVPGHEVRVFGSRAKGTARRTSDLDLAVMTEAPLGSKVEAQLKEAFEEAILPFKVDLVDWARCEEPFRRIIDSGFDVIWPSR